MVAVRTVGYGLRPADTLKASSNYYPAIFLKAESSFERYRACVDSRKVCP